MNETKRNAGRVVLYASVIGAMAVSMIPANAQSAAAQGQTRKIGNFDVAGRFLEVWSRYGNEQDNLYVNGLPITARRAEISPDDGKTYESQWFERAKFEAHPENKAPYDVLLGRLGANFVSGRGSIDPATKEVRNKADVPFVGIDKPGDTSATKLWYPETKHTLSGKFLEWFNKYGGLQQFGFPLSEQFQEISATDGKTYTVQYFERNRMELHPEKAGTPYEVELGLLGVQQYQTTPVGRDQLPIAPPKGMTSAKDTLVTASAQLNQISTMFGVEDSTVVAQRILWAVTFQDGMVGLDDKENFFPLLAWYVPTLENGGSYYVGAGDDRHLVTKYRLRQGIKWSDGQEIDSNDAMFSHKLILDDPNAVSISVRIKVFNADNPDKYTAIYNWMSLNQAREMRAKVQREDPEALETTWSFLDTFINFKRPVTDLFYQSIGTVHAQHKLQNIPVTDISASSEGEKPTGYGPYMVQELKIGEQVTLVANPNYNLTDPPLIKRIINRQVAQQPAQVQNFLSGAVELIESEGTVIPPDNAADVTKAGGVIVNMPAATWEHLEPRIQDAKDGFAQFGQKEVRQALAFAINRARVAEVAFRGAAVPNNSPAPPIVFHSLDSAEFAKEFPDLAQKYKLPIYNYDPAKAVQLLEAAGWKCPAGTTGNNCGGQIREKDGQKLTAKYGTTASGPRQATQALVVSDAKAVGMELVATIETNFFGNTGNKATGDVELAQFAYSQTSFSGFDPYDSSQWNTAELSGGQNQQHYANDKVDAANRLFAASATRKEIAEQSAIVQVEMMNDVAVIPLVQRANIVIHTGKLKNVKVTNSQAAQYWNVTQWYFER